MSEQTNGKPKNYTRKGVSIRKYDLVTKRLVAEEVLSGQITAPLAALKHTIPYHTLLDWVKQFSGELACPMKKPYRSPGQESELETLRQQKQALEEALTAARLRITGLETLIDLAEKELSIDIRKKSGTKPSDK